MKQVERRRVSGYRGLLKADGSKLALKRIRDERINRERTPDNWCCNTELATTEKSEEHASCGKS